MVGLKIRTTIQLLLTLLDGAGVEYKRIYRVCTFNACVNANDGVRTYPSAFRVYKLSSGRVFRICERCHHGELFRDMVEMDGSDVNTGLFIDRFGTHEDKLLFKLGSDSV